MAVWHRTIRLTTVFRREDMTYPQRRDAIVDLIRTSGWPAENPDVAALVHQLAAAATVEAFDRIWNRLYDHADVDRIWIETF